MKNGHGGAFERASEYGSGEAAEYAAGSGKEKERGTSVGGEKGGTAEEGAESGRALEAAAEYESDEILVKAAQSGDKQATEELLVQVRQRRPRPRAGDFSSSAERRRILFRRAWWGCITPSSITVPKKKGA